MTPYVDTSVLVAAVVEDEPNHEACLQLLRRKNLVCWTHALAETFATLTGGRLGIRVAPEVASDLIEESLLPRLRLVELSAEDLTDALRSSQAIGVRGGAIFDYLHLAAARKSTATALYTLNVRHFSAVARPGDPPVEKPV